MYGSAHANRIATRRNKLQTFLADTTHAQGHSTVTQQVMQMLSVQTNSYNFSEGGKKKYLADLASQRKVWPSLQNAVVRGVCLEILQRDRKGRQVWLRELEQWRPEGTRAMEA